jgi:hypothetical protein
MRPLGIVSVAGSPFLSAGTIGIAMAKLAAQDFQSLNFQSLNDPIT